MIELSNQLEEVKGIGPRFIERLKKLNIKIVKDLLWHFPTRYEDFSKIIKISDLKINQRATVSGIIKQVKLKRTWKRRMFILEALVADDTGSIKAIWFNGRYLLPIIKKGKFINLAGKITENSKEGLIMSHPVYEIVNQQFISEDAELTGGQQFDTKHTGRIVPIYPETKGLTSKGFRYLIKPILENLEIAEEFLPENILKENNFPEINEALNSIHFPKESGEAKSAKKRFAFEDLFLLNLINLQTKLKIGQQKAIAFKEDIDFIRKLLEKLPFELTLSQKKSLWEILQDMAKFHPMNRLLQGDVGSGKTIVAAIAALVSAKAGKQTAFMAPTEILARQHYFTFQKFFSDFSGGVGLITSKETKIFYGDGLESEIKKTELLKKINSGEIKIVFGTHSLIQKNIKFGELSLVIIDEQHRFGVRQRAELLKNEKSDFSPHFLSMSATPIPRTLTLTIFGDLDLSIIDELPKNRKPIITKVVAPSNRDKAYAFIRGQVKKGRQTFVVCPRIERTTDNEQEAAAASYKSFINLDVKAVKEEYEKLEKKIFPDLKVKMLHGKMKQKEKNQIMNDFKDKKIDILVSTSVIEVGVDVPNAAIMMIEGADRFGLAQLYQFRGRVGRGEHQSFCFLFTDSLSKETYRRLYSIVEAKNGFELAEKDLEIRGPGEFLGQSQTGYPDLSMKAIQNPDLVKSSREAAQKLLGDDMKLKEHPLLKRKLEEFEKEIHLE
ncbi:MAG: ATP-dependent DNA helicase [Candidatus Wolfebacteria bacterium GW2011_GWC1_37_10]|uniref:ATP-dependent DNA helicase RecG n=1 Tax=Candidatus Wolfebacteria bacterium GW2011_GWC1_37_10 TaxID=1619010 RepID=A0A0G0FW45_9BACT|nr:MAG: ATP-dependent DNA helicase [Candidatus Wolfebacteria bacterium GW2011_GWC1_37_10]